MSNTAFPTPVTSGNDNSASGYPSEPPPYPSNGMADVDCGLGVNEIAYIKSGWRHLWFLVFGFISVTCLVFSSMLVKVLFWLFYTIRLYVMSLIWIRWQWKVRRNAGRAAQGVSLAEMGIQMPAGGM
ncbi:hypothetical protein BJ508DRAFT_313860 [Ascobolus immersus RN42]|uniref:Uncharacterized protein n=1 Tax=Ascobolus immersus RN42 TaxID=1160509 RepID=A0A3N4HMQ8_ASCIM|nr:hypothetical protein BJ508DRAFT_313860 [Ascobolus immersus RN42]